MNTRPIERRGNAMRRTVTLSSLVVAIVLAPRAFGQGAPAPTVLSLDPADPQASALPGGIRPAFGSQPTRPADWRFDFHGFLLLPLRVGVNHRDTLSPGQAKTVLHAPPVIPGDFESFGYTSVLPDPWAQVNFSYGNKDVTATVIIAARTVTDGDAYYNPPDQLGINDAFLTLRVPGVSPLRFNVNVGAFSNRYGNMGEYDAGRYGTPVIARIGGVGVTGTAAYPAGDFTLSAEAGLMGQLNKAPLGVEPAGWNGYLDPNVGTSFVPHVHAGVAWSGTAQMGLHFLRALSQDDRATPTTQPDGYIDVMGADARLTLGRFGHLYAAVAKTSSHHARAVSDIIRVLNAPGGPGLMNEYFGPDSGGSGDLLTAGGQYDLSVGNLLRYPEAFDGDGPDLVLSAFGMETSVKSPDPAYTGKSKLKYGTELGWSLLSWFALSARYDRVLLDTKDATQTSAIVSPRLIFRTDWKARDQVVLQYSRYLNGSGVLVKSGAPPLPDPSIRPDKDVVMLSASMWW
jgi:hypothetical protein